MSQAAPVLQHKKSQFRNPELDFLRGCAIFLVLRFHHVLDNYTSNIGWTGVDLFFVLSGFLVSGLYFAEYKKFGNVKPLNFLTRRGFKIYPLFYVSITAYLLIYFFNIPPTLNYKGVAVDIGPRIFSEVFFLQNYITSFWAHHWSLAVEEHFYILLSILIYFLTKRGLLNNHRLLILLSSLIFGGCLLLRIAQNYFSPDDNNFLKTHLRIDALFMGVTISYFYHFYPDQLNNFYRRFKYVLLILLLIPLSFVPFLELHASSFIKTIGFTLVYIGFGSLLIIFLLSQTVKSKLPKILTPFFYRIVCFIGVHSYGIYLFHVYIIFYLISYFSIYENDPQTESFWIKLSFVTYFLTSILLGIMVSYLIEKPSLRLRDKYFPRRT